MNVAENCPPGGLNNAIRQIMADIRVLFSDYWINVFAGSSPADVRDRLGVADKSAAANALVGLTPAANKIAYYTGTATAAMADISATGRAIIGGADQAASRAAMAAAGSAEVFGFGQLWAFVARAATTVYQNNTGKPIQLAVTFEKLTATSYFQVSADNVFWVIVAGFGTASGTYADAHPIVPDGHYYRISDAANVINWSELR